MSTVSNIQSGDGPGVSLEATRNRASRAEVTDARGRKIVIRKLSALDKMDLFEALGPSLSENAMYFSYAMSAACTDSIDGDPCGTALSKTMIRALIQRLDDEGLEAVSRGYREHFSGGETGDPEALKK